MKHQTLMEYLEFILGILLVAISFNLFLLPNNILVGSIISATIIVKHLSGIHPTFFILIVFSILLTINIIFLKKITLKSVIGVFLLTSLISVTSSIKLYFTVDNNLLLSTICGSILMGIGYALVLKRSPNLIGFIKIKFKPIIILFNIFILVIGTLIFGITNIMYSGIAIYIMNQIVDKILLKMSSFKVVHIITKSPKEIKKIILNNKLFKVKENVFICLVPTKEYFKIKEAIYNIDPTAMLITTDAYEVHNGS